MLKFITKATVVKNEIKTTNKGYNEALEDGDFVGIANDGSAPKNPDEDFEYLCKNSIAINYLEQIERLEDNKKCKIFFMHDNFKMSYKL